MQLKINAPFKNKDEVLPLIEAGADELYCGYLAPYWKRRFTDLEFERKGGGSNFEDLKELEKAVKLAHSRNIPVAATLNGLYVANQYPALIRVVKELSSLGIDAFIVADLGLLLWLKEKGCLQKIHISTGGTVFNSESCVFYKQFGINRVVLDRQTSFASMKELCQDNPDIEFEVFILNTLCVYIDGFCTFMHAYSFHSEQVKAVSNPETKINLGLSYNCRSSADACCLNYTIKVYDQKKKRVCPRSKIRPVFFKHLIDCIECGACALYDISQTGVYAVKIVGRQFEPQKHIEDTRFISQSLAILKNNPGILKLDFLAKVQELYRKTYNYAKTCQGNNCYFPEVLL